MKKHLIVISVIPLFFICQASVAKASIVPSITVKVKGISCSYCVTSVDRRLRKLPGVQAVEADERRGVFRILRTKKGRLSIKEVEQTVQGAGFAVDSMSIVALGLPTVAEGKRMLREKESGQSYLLLELSEKKWEKLMEVSQGGKKEIWVEGDAHSHADAPVGISVKDFGG